MAVLPHKARHFVACCAALIVAATSPELSQSALLSDLSVNGLGEQSTWDKYYEGRRG